MPTYIATEKEKKAQRVRNWNRRRAIRQGIRPKDFVTHRRRWICDGRFSTKP